MSERLYLMATEEVPERWTIGDVHTPMWTDIPQKELYFVLEHLFHKKGGKCELWPLFDEEDGVVLEFDEHGKCLNLDNWRRMSWNSELQQRLDNLEVTATELLNSIRELRTELTRPQPLNDIQKGGTG